MSLVRKKAPNFSTGAVINGTEIVESFSLEQYIGNKEVLFFFYPKDFTYVCPTEILAFQANLEEFEKRGVQVVGCSTDTEETHIAWLNTPKKQGGIEGVTYPMVADTAKTVASNFGVLAGDWNYTEGGDLEFEGTPVAFRGSFFIDKEGIVRHESINDLPLGRNIGEYLRIIDAWHHHEKYGEVCPANWQEGKDAMKESREGVVEYLSSH